MNKEPARKKEVVVNSRDVAERGMRTITMAIIALVLIAIIMMFTNGSRDKYYNEAQFAEFNEGWELSVDGVRSNFSFPRELKLEPGQEAIISKRLPSHIAEYTSLVSRNYHMEMQVTVDGDEVYRYPQPTGKFTDHILVDDWNVINLKTEMESRVIAIKFTASRAGFNGVIRPVYLGVNDSIMGYLRDKYMPLFVTGISILIAGALILFVGLLYFKYDKEKTQPIVGVMLLITGVWLTNRSKMPIMGMGSPSTFLSCFIVLAIVPFAIGIYAMTRFPDKNTRITRALVGIDLLFFFIILLLIALRITILELALPVYIAMAVNVVYVEYNLWGYAFGSQQNQRTDRERLKDRIEFVTNFLMLVGFIIETVTYTDELMTEINMINRVAFNIFASGHIAHLLLDSYNGVKDRTAAVQQLHESQVAMLMGQIQPHFIFNTLSSIRTLIKVDPDIAYEMVYNFSNYLRANVDNVTNLEGIKLAAEIEHIKSYVNIEKVRFGDRVNVIYDIMVSDFMVPPLSIQPLVENAIKHGICPKPTGGNVWIRSYPTEHYNVVEVQDDGLGFSAERLEEVFSGSSEDVLGTDRRNEASILEETLQSSSLLDERGRKIDISHDIIERGSGNLTGNGSEIHVSTGIRNVILRLKEMANASVEIESKEGEGSLFRVLFPID